MRAMQIFKAKNLLWKGNKSASEVGKKSMTTMLQKPILTSGKLPGICGQCLVQTDKRVAFLYTPGHVF
jgi:hypothetical protein